MRAHLTILLFAPSRSHELLFAGLEAQFPVRKLSKPFFVVRKTVEFLIGLLMPKDHKSIILCFGEWRLVRMGRRR